MSEEPIAEETLDAIAFRATPEVLAAFAACKVFLGRPRTWLPDDRITMSKSVSVEPYSGFPGASLFDCGAFSYSETSGPLTGLTIGRYCSIAAGLSIFGARHPIEWVTSSSMSYDFLPGLGYEAFTAAHADLLGNAFQPQIPEGVERPFPVIEHDVWIGQNVQLARAIRVGAGSVIAAGSVVTRDVEPYTIVAGSPARVIRRRFSETIAERLLASEWWRFHPRHLFQLGFTDPEAFLDRFERERDAGGPTLFEPPRIGWRDIAASVAHRETIEAEELVAAGMLREGWSGLEPGFVCALGASSVIALPAGRLADFTTLDLQFHITPFRAQRVSLRVRTAQGERTVASQLLTGSAYVSMRLAPDLIVDGELVIELDHPDFCRPADVGYGSDGREVSVAIHCIVLR